MAKGTIFDRERRDQYFFNIQAADLGIYTNYLLVHFENYCLFCYFTPCRGQAGSKEDNGRIQRPDFGRQR